MKAIAVFLFLFCLSGTVQAFPELSRHGYVNCTTCHLSPSGFGVLTEYGREMSKELLATWAIEGEQRFAYDLLTPPEALLVAGYIRTLQVHKENTATRIGYPIVMQADVEAAYNTNRWAVAITAGRQEIGAQPKAEGRFSSRRHYGLFRVSEEHSVRLGKFQKFYGLNDPNHNLYVRRRLGFQQDTETYNAEYAWLGEKFSTYLTYVFGGLSDSKSRARESGPSLSTSYFLFDKHKIGASYFYGEDDARPNDTRRVVMGPWFIVSWTDRLYSLSEFDYQRKENRITKQTTYGYVTSNRLSFEVHKGIIPFVLFEQEHLDRDRPQSKLRTFGLGAQFFPRPHFELSAAWQKERVFSSPDYSDLAWIMLNFYL